MPARTSRGRDPDRRAWRPPALVAAALLRAYIETLPASLARLRRGRFDVAHAFFPTDAYAAALLRGRGGPPFVFSIHGIPTAATWSPAATASRCWPGRVRAAGELTVLSEAAARPVARATCSATR